MSCVHCGGAAGAGGKFCVRCGHALPPPLPAVRRPQPISRPPQLRPGTSHAGGLPAGVHASVAPPPIPAADPAGTGPAPSAPVAAAEARRTPQRRATPARRRSRVPLPFVVGALAGLLVLAVAVVAVRRAPKAAPVVAASPASPVAASPSAEAWGSSEVAEGDWAVPAGAPSPMPSGSAGPRP